MMLLTAVTFGGQDALPVLGHLPDEEAAVLRHRAERMLEIPRDRRIPLLVQEIKRLVTARKGHLWSAEPEALAKLLQQERPALRELILRALPVALADAVRLHLPATAVQVREEVPAGVLGIVRWKLEGLLQQASAGTLWKFSDLLMLKPRELYTLADRQGCRALATALAALLGEEQASFFQALPPELSSLAQRAVAAAAGRELPQADARALLAQHGAEGSPLEAIRSAGIQRIARACLAQGADFAPRLVERHRPPFAPVFQRWMNDERTRAAAKGDGGRAEIVADLERLEVRGLVEKPARLPAMSRKPVVPPPAAQVKARPSVPSPAPPVPSSGSMPIHERVGERSKTPPVPPPAASWDAPPGTLDPRVASRAMRSRAGGGTAPVLAPMPQRPGAVPVSPELRPRVTGEGEPGAGPPPRYLPAYGPAHERGSELPERDGQGLQGRSSGRSSAGEFEGNVPAREPGAGEVKGRSRPGEAGRGPVARRARLDAGADMSEWPSPGESEREVLTRRPGAGGGESRAPRGSNRGDAGREVQARRPGAAGGDARAQGRSVAGDPGREALARRSGAGGGEARAPGRPGGGMAGDSRSPGRAGGGDPQREDRDRRSSPSGRPGVDDAERGAVRQPGAAWPLPGPAEGEGDGAEEMTAAIRPPRPSQEPGGAPAPSSLAVPPASRGEPSAPVFGSRPKREGVQRPEPPRPSPADEDDDEATHAFRPPRRKSEPVPVLPSADTVRPPSRSGGGEALSAGPGAVVASAAEDERTVSLRRGRLGLDPPVTSRGDDEDDEKTLAIRAPRPPAGRRPAEGTRAGDETLSAEPPGPGQAQPARSPESPAVDVRENGVRLGAEHEEATTAGFPARQVVDDDEVTSFIQRPTAGAETRDGASSSVRAPSPPPVPRVTGETGSNEVTASSLSAIRRGGAAASGASQAPPSSPSERPGRVPPPGPDAAYARTAAFAPVMTGAPAEAAAPAGHDVEDLDRPGPTEELAVPAVPLAGAGRVQGTAHLRGPVVTRPPQRRRSDSRIRKAVEAPIAPAPPSPQEAAEASRSPRVVRSSARHKAVKGPGRGPGGGTG